MYAFGLIFMLHLLLWDICEIQSAPAELAVKNLSLASSLPIATPGLSGSFAAGALHDRQTSLLLQAWTMKCLLQVLPLTFTPLFPFPATGKKKKKVSLVLCHCEHEGTDTTLGSGGWEGCYSKQMWLLEDMHLSARGRGQAPVCKHPENNILTAVFFSPLLK